MFHFRKYNHNNNAHRTWHNSHQQAMRHKLSNRQRTLLFLMYQLQFALALLYNFSKCTCIAFYVVRLLSWVSVLVQIQIQSREEHAE